MNYKISLQEMTLKGKAILLKQPKPTLKLIKEQVAKLKAQSQTGQKKKGYYLNMQENKPVYCCTVG